MPLSAAVPGPISLIVTRRASCQVHTASPEALRGPQDLGCRERFGLFTAARACKCCYCYSISGLGDILLGP